MSGGYCRPGVPGTKPPSDAPSTRGAGQSLGPGATRWSAGSGRPPVCPAGISMPPANVNTGAGRGPAGAAAGCAGAGGRRVDDHVMDHGAVAGTHFVGLDPLVFGEAGRHFEVLVGDGAGRRDRVVLLHRQHRVGLADRPALGIVRRRRQVAGDAFRRAGRHPAGNRVLLRVRQPAVVFELADAGGRVPRRHAAGPDARGDRPRPGAHLGVVHERHRRDLPGAMAGGAVGVENRRHVLAVGGGPRRRRGLRRQQDRRGQTEHRKHPERQASPAHRAASNRRVPHSLRSRWP